MPSRVRSPCSRPSTISASTRSRPVRFFPAAILVFGLPQLTLVDLVQARLSPPSCRRLSARRYVEIDCRGPPTHTLTFSTRASPRPFLPLSYACARYLPVCRTSRSSTLARSVARASRSRWPPASSSCAASFSFDPPLSSPFSCPPSPVFTPPEPVVALDTRRTPTGHCVPVVARASSADLVPFAHCFSASWDASYVTGNTLHANGGQVRPSARSQPRGEDPSADLAPRSTSTEELSSPSPAPPRRLPYVFCRREPCECE